MARFLSPEWFDQVRYATPPNEPPGDDSPLVPLVVEQVVTGTPDGEVRYVIVADRQSPRIETGPPEAEPDVTITVDWPTACAVAQGALSTQQALMEGRLRVRGNLTRLGGRVAELNGLDPIPPDVRRTTTF
jgi:SCP-2 sterol transfer family